MDSMLLFALMFLALAFALLGFYTKYKILSVLSAGVFIALMVELQTNAALTVVFAGVVLFLFLYAFGVIE